MVSDQLDDCDRSVMQSRCGCDQQSHRRLRSERRRTCA
ncbi:Hypothetical protein A7982_08256 [Minicystis rosea]|nr:Hypothetical protein A7982_08256 [Minicystis rosea]